jgi:hypothetical protein
MAALGRTETLRTWLRMSALASKGDVFTGTGQVTPGVQERGDFLVECGP